VGALLSVSALNGQGISRCNKRHDLLSAIQHFFLHFQDILSYDIIAFSWRWDYPFPSLSFCVCLTVTRVPSCIFGFALVLLFWHFALSLLFRIYMVIWVLCIYTVRSTIPLFWLDSLHGRRSLSFFKNVLVYSRPCFSLPCFACPGRTSRLAIGGIEAARYERMLGR
jgi:hypothetical protein